MVAIKEVENMFWGVTLDGGKRYTQTVETTFHISMAAMEVSQTKETKNNPFVSVMLQHDKAEFLLCTLQHSNVLQVPLDLNFTEGEQVTFFLNGKGVVHLTGYLCPELLDDVESDDSDDDDEEDDVTYEQGQEERASDSEEESGEEAGEIPKLIGFDEDISDDEEDISDDEIGMSDEEEEDDEEEEEDETPVKGKRKKKQEASSSMKKKKAKLFLEDEVEESDEEDEDVSSSFLSNESAKKSKKQKATKEQVESPATNGATPESLKKKKKKNKKKNKGDGTPGQTSSADNTPVSKKMDGGGDKGSSKKKLKKMSLGGGVVAEDTREGHGPVATPGKMVGVYYTGTLFKGGKKFDSATSGTPFKFRLGKQEVIKGWDVGVKGMKVGGKRKLTIPAAMAYGAQRQGPIPPNSTLVFDVELKNVS